MGATSSIDLEVPHVETRAATSTRVGNLDVLRAVAALGVLAIHAYALGGRVAPVKAQYWYDVPLISLTTGVWLFFGISGYVITRPFVKRLIQHEPLPPVVPYAIRRALRIFPLYWLALSVFIAIEGSMHTKAWQLVVHYLLLNNLVPGRQEALFSVAWTLTLEVLFYFAVPLLALMVRRARPTITAERLALWVLVSWVASIGFTVIADLQGDGEIGLWLRGSFPAMWQMFCPGILLAIAPYLGQSRARKLLLELPRTRGAAAVVAPALVVGAVLGAAAPLRFGIVTYQLVADASRPLFAVGYGLVIAAALGARPPEGRARWAVQLGLISYGIYLLHPVILAALLHAGISPVHSDTLPAFVVNVLCVAGLTLTAAFISWTWFEQPLIGLGRRLSRR